MVEDDLLRSTRIFRDCNEHDIACLSDIARTRRFADGEVIFTLGEKATELMVIASGEVQLELPLSVMGEKRNIPFATKARGDVVGWSSLAVPNRFTLSGRSVGSTTLLAFRREDLTPLFDIDPTFGLRVVTNVLALAWSRLDRTHRMWVREIQRSVDERFR